MPFNLHINVTGGGGELADQWPRILDESKREFGRWWHENYYPLHFEPFAVGRYGYQPRTQKYQERKRREKGHNTPLVWSGSFKEESTSWAEISTSSTGAIVKMRAQVLNFVGRAMKDPAYPNLKDEATAVAPEETQRFAEWLQDVTSGRLNSLAGNAAAGLGPL